MRVLLRKGFQIFLCVILNIMLFGCAESGSMDLENVSIEHETEFGGAYIHITIQDFLDLGYQFGDSVLLEFSNGFMLEDLPFYNGYYVPLEEPLLIGYPGYPYIKAVLNCDDDLWEIADLDENTTVSISLYEKGKYLSVMQERNLEQVSGRDAFDTDESYANFRSLKGGKLKEDLIYRGSSPIDNTYGRASYTCALIEEAGIQLIMNLSDTEEKMMEHLQKDEADPEYYIQLYEEGKVLLPQLTITYSSDEMKRKVADLLRTMSSHEGPYFMHCALGKDRTGFVSLLLEMLAGASYQEMLDDYMLSYDSFYRVTEYSDPQKYDMIQREYFSVLMKSIVTDEHVDQLRADLTPYAEQYLKDGGMSEADLEALRTAVMN